MEESFKMTEDIDKSRKYVHGVANPVIEDGKEQNRTGLQLSDSHPIAKRVTVSKVRSI